MKKLLKILFILVLTAALIFGITKLNDKKKIVKTKASIVSSDETGTEISTDEGSVFYMPGISAEEIEERKNVKLEELKTIDSEIEGWTLYDKVQAGLNPYSEDTDGDGLSDKEEIEVYMSDATKKSTAGDLYTDKYKVDNDMDLFTFYDYEGDYEYQNVKVNNIIPVANTVDEAGISVTESRYSLEELTKEVGKEVYQAYHISSEYHIPVKVDLSDILKENDIKIEDITVINCEVANHYSEDNLYRHEDAKFTVDGNTLTIEGTDAFDDNSRAYDVIIVSDKIATNLLSKAENIKNDIFVDGEFTEEMAKERGLAFCRSHELIPFRAATIYYYDTGNEELNNWVIEAMQKENTALSHLVRDDFAYEYVSVSYEELMAKINRNNKSGIFSNLHMSYDETGEFTFLLRCCFGYFTSEDLERGTDFELAKRQKKNRTDFSLGEEIFPFANFVSYREDNGQKINGHCAAIAMITAKAHNGSYVTPQGEWSCMVSPRKSVAFSDSESWDISGYYDNATLMDKNLFDFRNSDFVDAKGNITETSDSTDEFVKLCNCYLEKYNNISDNYCDYLNFIYDNEKYPYYNVENMKEFLDSGKILVASFCDAKMGHVVNIYDYEETEDTVEFLIYDNNRPTEVSRMIVRHSEDPYYMDYVYDAGYHVWTSEEGQLYQFLTADENFHFITDVKAIDAGDMTYSYKIANKEIDKLG